MSAVNLSMKQQMKSARPAGAEGAVHGAQHDKAFSSKEEKEDARASEGSSSSNGGMVNSRAIIRILHEDGVCLPCHFFWSRRGCLEGDDCTMCHAHHEDMSRSAIRRAYKHACQTKKTLLPVLQPGTCLCISRPMHL
mmetsp:Transcript_19070/g.43303  ORF Transcript_19070/g.43303 Transcript_19070/m.43303 type:complete len:137 (-) Transcript_19070:102-512(-)